MRSSRAVTLFLLAAAAAAGACGEGAPLAPRQSADGSTSSGPGSGGTSTTSLRTVLWAQPLAADLTASATIGAAGGTIKLSAVGLTVTVPAGALALPTTITVTAPAGSDVAYMFEPHGTVFALPVKIEQDLRYVATGQFSKTSSPAAGYFSDDNAMRSCGPGDAMSVDEVRPASLDVRGSRVSFTVNHFSGYMVSSGLVDTLVTTGTKR